MQQHGDGHAERDDHGPEIENERPERHVDALRHFADAMRQRAGEIVAEEAVRVVLQIGIHLARDFLALPGADPKLEIPRSAAKQHLAQTQAQETTAAARSGRPPAPGIAPARASPP
jgi:hypothetical protein